MISILSIRNPILLVKYRIKKNLGNSDENQGGSSRKSFVTLLGFPVTHIGGYQKIGIENFADPI